MKATKIHYFFAQGWLEKIWHIVFSSVFVIYGTFGQWGFIVSPTTWVDPLFFLGGVFLYALLGYFVGILVGWPIIGPIYYNRSLKNGEPFHKGETVQILVGPYRGRIVPVMEAWDAAEYAGGHRIHVDLRSEVEDNENIFTSTEILRVSPKINQ
jgi:hypothetical protein